MTALFLTVSLCLVAALQAQDVSPLALNNENSSGKWFVKALVMKDEIPIEKVSPLLVLKLSNGDMELSLTHMVYGLCLEVTTILKKTDVPGQYTAFEGKSHVQVQLSSVKNHCMLYCDGEVDGMSFTVTQLIGRDLEENLEALEEFKEFTQKKRLVPENLIIPEQMEKCEPEND
ncbi:vomeronasal secretory protein 1-like [Meriones unguiculatus]|uniref:vomeronasal secretory protein 1-like n=1 Tax=Meriones unguiculatus TaxID=10047 RepID=UPI000B4EF01A|nr:vomeronasal secretory protein 1-like [Meriones unguiculatus]XP_060246556.1 vomeronasal secretory protein 1-like [Meriones unguiculatus]XP_060246557.1 vomeronasal secretory protein 1-like [Meriones unguiculatus]